MLRPCVHDERGTTTLRTVLSDISELKKAESALHQSEVFNRAVLDSLDAEIAVLDRDGTIVAVNQAWQRFASENAARPGQLEALVRVGVNYLAVCDAVSDFKKQDAVEAHAASDGIRAVLDGRLRRFNLEYPCHSPEMERWFSMNVTPLGDGVVVSHTNISQIKQLEEKAQASARYSRSLIESNLDPMVTIGEDGMITDANRASERITGVSRDALISSSYADYFTSPKDVRAGFQQVISQGYLTDYPLVIRHVSGKATDVLVNASLYRNLDGKVLGVFASAHDITERQLAIKELREQKEFFHLIAENISDFIAVLDREGRRIYTSPSYAQLLGADIESDPFGRVHPDDRERVKQVLGAAVSTGQGFLFEYRLMVADGSIRIMESRGSVIPESDGRLLQVIVVSHDITERKQLENRVQLMAFHDTLTQLPNRRLLNDRMSQTMAASERSGYYAAVMFLDLDNFKPLNDTYGHDVGDKLLIEVADRLQHCVREMDTVARFGGDEFVVMMSQFTTNKAESIAEAGIIAEKIRRRLVEPYWLTVKHTGQPEETIEYRCSASIGVVVFVDHEATQESILKSTDAAMYQAKESGRNSIRFFDLELDRISGTEMRKR